MGAVSEETPTRRCLQCGNEISALVTHCPACGQHQKDVQFPEPLTSSPGAFELEDDDAPPPAAPQPTSTPPPPEPPPEPMLEPDSPPPSEEISVPAPDVDPDTQRISSEDLPLEAVVEEAGDTVRMSVADLGKAWLEETAEMGAVDPPPEAPPATKRKGCLPVLAILCLPMLVVAVLLLG